MSPATTQEKGHHIHALMIGMVVVLVIGVIVLGATVTHKSNADGGATAAEGVAFTKRAIQDAGLQVCRQEPVTWNGGPGAIGGALFEVALHDCGGRATDEDIVVVQVFDSRGHRNAAIARFQNDQPRRRSDGAAWTYGNSVVVVQGPTSSRVERRLRDALEAQGAK
jgi:hypothetical protein